MAGLLFGLRPSHPVDVSRLCHGNVPSVLRMFCPFCVDLHGRQVRTSRMSPGIRSQVVPGTLPRHTDRHISLCVFVCRCFLLPKVTNLLTRYRVISCLRPETEAKWPKNWSSASPGKWGRSTAEKWEKAQKWDSWAILRPFFPHSQ